VPLDALVVEELQLRGPAEAQAAGHLPAQERRRALEGPRRFAPRLLVPERRVVDVRVLEIGETSTRGS
jgi:hypothetical protein